MPESEERLKAEKAIDKKALFGPDLDLKKFSLDAEKHPEIGAIKDLPEDYKKEASDVGVIAEEEQRSGSFFQLDHSVICARPTQEGLEVLSITDARKKYEWLKDYNWKAVAVDADKYTAQAELQETKGYFIRAKSGVKTTFPLQACLFIGKEGLAQNVHNIIIAEEGSELHIITGCTTSSRVKSGLHIGISEFYIKKNAKISFTMIHGWADEMHVRPRSAAIVEEGGVFTSNYICMKPVKSLQMYPTAYLNGKNSVVSFNTILYAVKDSYIDVGSRVYLRGEGSRADIIARTIAKDKSQIIARGHIIGEIPKVKAHLECRGLLLSDTALIHAIPELEGRAKDVDLSHEAAVGKIAEQEILYLMSRGLTEDEAVAVIIRGFLSVDIKGLPEKLKAEMQKIIDFDMQKML